MQPQGGLTFGELCEYRLCCYLRGNRMSKAAAVLEVHALSTLLAIYATKALHRARTQESTSHDMNVAHLIACQLQEVIEFIPRRVTRTFCIRGGESIREFQIHPKVSKQLAHTQICHITYWMRSIQNGVIECNKLISRVVTRKPSPPKVSGHNVNPHPKILDGSPCT